MTIKFSCIILAYNQERYLEESLTSLENQSRMIDEIIISNDASTDSTKRIIEKFIAESKIPSIKFIDNQANLGINGCLNKAFPLVTGDVVLLQAGDDISDPFRAAFVEKVMAENDQAGFILTSYKILDDLGHVTGYRKRKGYINHLSTFIKRGAAFPIQGVAFRSKLIPYLLPMDTLINNEDDFICFAGMIHCGGIHLYDFASYYYRIHLGSISGWSILETDKERLLGKWKAQFDNRRQNWEGWIRLLKTESSIKYHIEIVMLERKIRASHDIENIKGFDIIARVLVIWKFASLLSKRDWLYLVFGFRSLTLIRLIKRVLLGVKSRK